MTQTLNAKMAVMIASHINYDNQIIYFEKCWESLNNQTKPIDILCSISFENENYREKFNKMIKTKTMKNTKIFERESKKSQFQHLFSLIDDIKDQILDYDLLLFCDDDDTYDINRAKMFEGYYDNILSRMKKTSEKKIFGGMHEGNDPYKPTDYWRWVIPPTILVSFHDKIKQYEQIVAHKFCDVVFTQYIRKLNQSYVFAYLNTPYELYHYQQHDESVTGKIQLLKQNPNTNISEMMHYQLFLFACYLYSSKDCERTLMNDFHVNKKQLSKIFPTYMKEFDQLINIFKSIYF
jgi:hypothetical protein